MQWETIRKLARNKWVRVSAIGTPLLAWVGVVSDGFTYLGWLKENWDSIYHAVDHPWFYWMIPIAFGVLFWLGVKQVARAERETAESNAASARELSIKEEDAQQRLAKLPYLMTQAFVHSQEVFALERAIGDVRQEVEMLKRQLEPWLGDQEVNMNHHFDSPIRIEHRFKLPCGLTFEATNFDVPKWEPHWTCIDPEISTEPSPRPHVRGRRFYDPHANRPYQAAQRKNLAVVMQRLGEIEEIASQQRQQLPNYQRAVQQELIANGLD